MLPFAELTFDDVVWAVGMALAGGVLIGVVAAAIALIFTPRRSTILGVGVVVGGVVTVFNAWALLGLASGEH